MAELRMEGPDTTAVDEFRECCTRFACKIEGENWWGQEREKLVTTNS